MKFITLSTVCFFLAVAPASAVITLGTSNEIFGLTGIGPNAAGQGQSKMSWGACNFDGTTTTCTLSGSYTGLGAGGKYSFIVSYAGNGPFPLIAVTNPGSDFFFAQALSNYSFVIKLVQNNGPALNFYSFANFSFLHTAQTCTGIAQSSCSVGQVGQTPNATIAATVTGQFDPTPTFTAPGMISASGYGGFPSIAPATWVEMYGFNLATTLFQVWDTPDFTGDLAPKALGGTTVTIGGKPAFVEFVSPSQVNVQVPSDVPTGKQAVLVTTAGGTSLPFTVNVNAVQPGLLAPPSFVVNGKQNVVALFANTLTFVLPNTVVGVKTARARAGDILTFYGIGFGPVTPNIPAGQLERQANNLQGDVKFTFGGMPANVSYAGLVSGLTGLYQFNVTVPNVPAGDNVPVAFTLNGVAGEQNLVIAIQN